MEGEQRRRAQWSEAPARHLAWSEKREARAGTRRAVDAKRRSWTLASATPTAATAATHLHREYVCTASTERLPASAMPFPTVTHGTLVGALRSLVSLLYLCQHGLHSLYIVQPSHLDHPRSYLRTDAFGGGAQPRPVTSSDFRLVTCGLGSLDVRHPAPIKYWNMLYRRDLRHSGRLRAGTPCRHGSGLRPVEAASKNARYIP